jgi:hypothetical protein
MMMTDFIITLIMTMMIIMMTLYWEKIRLIYVYSVYIVVSKAVSNVELKAFFFLRKKYSFYRINE